MGPEEEEDCWNRRVSEIGNARAGVRTFENDQDDEITIIMAREKFMDKNDRKLRNRRLQWYRNNIVLFGYDETDLPLLIYSTVIVPTQS